MSEDTSAFIVSPDWLQAHLDDPALKIIDASWYLPAQKRNGAEEYTVAHIRGAVFFDQDAIADHTSGLPHTLSTPQAFADALGHLGIRETDTIVVHDGPGIFTAPRVWWMLKTMGAENVFVLDGGLDGWKAEGRPVTSDPTAIIPAVFTPSYNSAAVTSFAEMTEIVGSGKRQIADARSPGRFTGEEAEPRHGMRSGHMPGARSLPSSVFSQNGRFKTLSELRQTITDAGIDLDRPVVTTCGSGITAAIITLALHSLGHTDNTLYDGSWSEWGSRADTQIATGKD